MRHSAFALFLLFALNSYSTAQSGTLDSILASGILRVCIWPDYFGVSYRDPQTRQLQGIDIDLAHGLANELGVAIKFVDSSFAQLTADLSSKRCDIAMFGIGITAARREKLRFTRPYLVSDIYAVTSKSNRRIKRWADIDRPGNIVAVVKGAIQEQVMRKSLKQATLKILDTPQAREQEVQSGRADVFMTDYPFSQRLLQTSDWARLVHPAGTVHLTPYAWAMRLEDDDWADHADQYLQKIQGNGVLKRAAERHGLFPIAVFD